MFRRLFEFPDGTLRLRRVVPTAVGAAALGVFGSFLVFATPVVAASGTGRTLYVIGVVFVLKFPLVAMLWWLIMRNDEWPGKPVKWKPEESQEILAFLERQAADAVFQPDATARLAYLSREAWNVADNIDGEAKVDALTVALRIDERAGRIRAPGAPPER